MILNISWIFMDFHGFHGFLKFSNPFFKNEFCTRVKQTLLVKFDCSKTYLRTKPDFQKKTSKFKMSSMAT